MSVISAAEAAAEKVFHAVETEVEKIDGEALAEARRLLAEGKAAEQKALELAGNYKAELEALAAKLEPEVKAELETIASKLLAEITHLFGG
jgi:cell division septum initiation protein DivIVA